MKVAVIPARGGSQRIPGKNIRIFAGKPIIAYSIETAINSGLFDRVIVSTDDAKIAGIAEKYGAEIPFLRPPELANHHTGTTETIAHTVNWLRQHDQRDMDAVCCLYATAPFILIDDLKRGWDILNASSWQYVFAATTFASPIFRSFEENESGGIRMFFPDNFSSRSQDLPEALCDAASFYWGRPQAWLDGKRIFSEHSSVVRIPRWRVQDIDTVEDWVMAESMQLHAMKGASS